MKIRFHPTVSIILLAIVGLGLTLAIFNACSNQSRKKTVKIGILFPMSGRTELSATWAKKGVELALEDINAKGGGPDTPLKPFLLMTNQGPPMPSAWQKHLLQKTR